MADPFPEYDVLDKRDGPSWNEKTREVVDARIAQRERDPGLGARRIATLRRIAARIVPQPEGRPPVNIVAIILAKIGGEGDPDGFRHAGLPPLGEGWTRALDAIDAEARACHGLSFAKLPDEWADAVLRRVETGKADADGWRGMDPALFWSWRLVPDLVSAYWSHPSAWSAMGFGGPASPRGYVRLEENFRDPWEAEERDERRHEDARG